MKNIIIAIFLALSIVSCSTLDGVTALKDTSFKVSNGEIIHEIKSVELTPTELMIVDHSFNNLKSFIEKWDKVTDLVNFNEFIEDYSIAKNNYLAVHKVISDNFDRYPKELQTKFIDYKANANNLNKTVERMLIGKDIYATAKVGVKLAMLVVGAIK